MGVLSDIISTKRTAETTPVNDGVGGIFDLSGWLGGGSTTTMATPKTALTIAAFYNGVEQISNDIAKLPKSVYIKDGDSRNRDVKNPINYLLNTAPNDLMTAFDFWKIIVISAIIKGDGFAQIIRNSQSGIEESYNYLDYDDVKVFKTGNKLFYTFKNQIIDSENMLHIKYFSFDGLRGISLIKFAAKQLGITLDAQNYGSEVYKDKGIGYGVLETDKAVDVTNKKAIEDGFSNKMTSGAKFKTALLDEGFKYKSISITPAEAQFLETNKNGVLEICRWLNINPHKVKDYTSGTYANVYQQSIEHTQDSIMPWAIRIEQEIDRKSFTKDSNKYFKININALLRGDLESKRNYYTAMIYAGIMTRNEVRSLEEMNPIDGLNEILQPVNMQALSIAMELQKNMENGNSNK
jgi:HK97 family phage portal protein